MGVFINGRLHKEVRISARRNRMFTFLWKSVPDRRNLVHKGRKP